MTVTILPTIYWFIAQTLFYNSKIVMMLVFAPVLAVTVTLLPVAPTGISVTSRAVVYCVSLLVYLSLWFILRF